MKKSKKIYCQKFARNKKKTTSKSFQTMARDDDRDSFVQSPVWWAYSSIAFFTFIVWIVCGWRSQSLGHLLAGIFLSGLWPFLWAYYFYQRNKHPNWNFCDVRVL